MMTMMMLPTPLPLFNRAHGITGAIVSDVAKTSIQLHTFLLCLFMQAQDMGSQGLTPKMPGIKSSAWA